MPRPEHYGGANPRAPAPVALGPNFYQGIVPDPLDSATVHLATYDNGLLVYSGR
jgi:hypothetical protein